MTFSRHFQAIFCACLVAVVFGTSPNCVSNCKNKLDGDYQSCKNCSVYVTCSNGLTYDERPCPANLVWDDYIKRCEYTSTTCVPFGINDAVYLGQCLCKLGYKLERRTCVYDCQSGRAGNSFITYPQAEVICDVNADFFTRTLENCLNDCRRNRLCRSAVYYNNGRCFHSPCDPKRDLEFGTTPTFRQNPSATLYVRNCVL